MMEEKFNNIFCSKKCQDFILLYDGMGNYYLYYLDELLKEIAEPLTPKEIHKGYMTKLYAPYIQLKENPISNFIDELLTSIADKIGEKGNDNKIMAITQDLVRTIKDSYIDFSYNTKYFGNAPQKVLDKAMVISENKGYSNDVFEELITPKSIADEIKARVKPVLTNEEQKKANEIKQQIDKVGLLEFLNQTLDNIHKGNHKNIYRKTLAEFNIMRGAGSYLNETTAKAEAGKTFEDEIVYNIITPQRYIFEVSDITLASFVRYAIIDPNYFNRMTLYFGDFGSKKSFKKIEPIFDVAKRLITEKRYKYIKSNTDNDTEVIEIPMEVESIGAAYQTTKNSFTEDDTQLISRTLFSTPAKVEPKNIAEQIFYLQDDDTKQSKAESKAKETLKDFGLYLLSMVNNDIKIINPYFDVFWEYASKSESPIREFKQQLELFNAYCILTQNKCNVEYLKGERYIASEDQLKDYMNNINLENALIPYEYDFLEMIMAKGKAKELTILYTDSDLIDEDGNEKDIDLDMITTLTKCEDAAIDIISKKLQSKYEDADIILAKGDLDTKQLKELPQRLLSLYGFRSAGAGQKIFFRFNDLKHYYSKRTAYKNIDNVPQLLQSLHNKGYLGKYDIKQGRENLYYLTPMCDNLTSVFELEKDYNTYVTEYFTNAGYENF